MLIKIVRQSILLLFCTFSVQFGLAQTALVLQSDFGTRDAAVASMKGVAVSVAPDLQIFDVTHEIPPYNIWEASYRLAQTAEYWPAGTVFVSVVDPGVGSDRNSVVLKTTSGHFFVSPDNGTLTLVAEKLGIAEVREIDEALNRRKDSEKSYTFHGRDVYAFTGARLASGQIAFEQVGRKLPPKVIYLPYQKTKIENGTILGNIPILDIRYGNVWTNIGRNFIDELGINYGDSLRVQIFHKQELVYENKVPFAMTFSDVPEGKPLLYINSLDNLALAINMGNFSEVHKVGSGAEWEIRLKKVE